MKRTVKQTIFSLLLAFVFLPTSAQPAENRNFDADLESRAQRALQENRVNNLLTPQPSSQPRISRRQALNIAGERYEGNVLGVVLDNGGNSYRVRMDRDGTVFNVFVNASSGDVSVSSD